MAFKSLSQQWSTAVIDSGLHPAGECFSKDKGKFELFYVCRVTFESTGTCFHS